MNKLKIFAFFLLFFGSIASTSYSQTELPADKIYETVNNSVVVVIAYDDIGNQYQGSGIVINKEGCVVTNYHVCKDADKFEINHYKKEFKDVEILKQDPDKDILILKVKDNVLPPIKTANSSELKPGQRVYAIGSPEGYENSISEGIVSGFRKDANGNSLIQMTTPLTDGSSGGAVVNSKGELIGMSMSGQHDGSIYFAVPVEDILKLLETNYITSSDNNNTTTDNNTVYKTDKETLNYLSEGKNANKKQNYEDAVFYFSKYLENNLNDNEAYFYRGYARLKLKGYQLAIIDFTKSIGNGTENYEAYFFRGNAYYFLNDYSNAVNDYSSAIILAPDLAELYYNRGYAYHKLKNNIAAVDDWKMAIVLRPEYETELNPILKSLQESK